MLDGIKANRLQPQRLAHGRVNVPKPERLKKAQHLDVIPFAGLAHARLQKAPQCSKDLGQIPALQGSGLVEGSDLAFEQSEVVQRVEDEVLAGIRARMPGDDLGPTGAITTSST